MPNGDFWTLAVEYGGLPAIVAIIALADKIFLYKTVMSKIDKQTNHIERVHLQMEAFTEFFKGWLAHK